MNSTNQNSTVVGVFQDRAKAQQAINDLKRAGFREDQIGVTARDGKMHSVSDDEAGDSYAAEGGMAGLATGAGVGALWGLGIISGLLPAIGPAIAGGTLAALLSSAAAGAAAAGLAGALVGMGMSKDEAEYYESEFKAGRTIVTVSAGSRSAEALAIIRRFDGYERSSASQTTTESAASALESSASRAAAASTSNNLSASRTSPAAGERTVQAKEEQLHVNKDRQQVGEVTVRKEVHTEHKTIDVPVEREEVVIERHPVSGGAATDSSFDEGQQQIRIPVTEEHVDVIKTPVVKEEVTIGKRKVKDTERVSADLRKEEIKVEREGDVRMKDQRD